MQHRGEGARIRNVWLAACVLTVGSAIVATMGEGDHRSANVFVSVAVLGIGGLKARLIMWNFMEIRSAPGWLRLFAGAWLFGLLATIVVLYLQ